ncbi:hybrid sensor histidine kinase/response regulator transcription factor [Pontibacter qinzhouensis]|uniref:hybrid sensor histidine kinase/response regulator transcription factor n=1 Tax=Pontibacter qinzhouensis TaxID=2603253 RepID=UPI00164F839D|nr:two-component regulator propeller domain-containing protein [Pontibacter qinzhouensis]
MCLNSAIGQSLNLKFDHITSENGLVQNTIHGIVKDKYGYIWFGTWGGLCRYDGYKFRIYKYDPKNIKSISDNRIHNLAKDANEDIWVETFDDRTFCRYNYLTDDFERVLIEAVSPEIQELVYRRHNSVSISHPNNKYTLTLKSQSNSLVETHFKTKQDKIYTYNVANRWTLSDSYVTSLYKDDHNILWVGTFSNGVNKANLNSQLFDYYFHDPKNPKSIIDNNIRAICEDNAGNLWIGTRDKGITIIDKANNYRHLAFKEGDSNSINSNQVRRIFCDSRGYIWIGTRKGLDRYNPADGKIRHFEELGLKNTMVFGFTEDKAGDVWIASWNGVYRYNAQKDNFNHYNLGDEARTQHVRVIMEDKEGQLWAGTEGGGIFILKPTQGNDEVKIVRQIKYENDAKNTIIDNRINSIYEDKSGLIWVGTGNGLHTYNPKTKAVELFTGASGLAEATVAGIIEDDAGYIWISHKKGISRLNSKTLAVHNYTLQDGLQSNEFSDGAIVKSRFSNKLYLGGNNGYNSFIPDSIAPEPTLPKVVFTELQILNQAVAINQEVNGRVVLDRPLYLTNELTLNHQDRSIAIEFAALHYANPDGNKYAYMLEGFDKEWIYTDASRRLATYSNLAPGKYVFKVKASNSDGIWNEVPTTLNIGVMPPFWASIWAYILYGLFILLALYLFYYFSARFTKLKSKLAYESLIREKEHDLNQNKLQFFTNISHEIKTPLSLILAPVERLLSVGKNNELLYGQLQTMKANGDRLMRLVNQLLDFRRLETGNSELVLRQHDLIAFLHSIIESFRTYAAQKNISLEFSPQTQTIFMRFDEDKLEKVISNLLSNAFKFTPSGGTIALEVSQDLPNDNAVIKVMDNGKGIPDEEKELIFKPFQQGITNKAGGTGLGLTYSKALVELHGGNISVDCSKQSDGQNLTVFTVTLPTKPTATITSETANSPATQAAEIAEHHPMQHAALEETQPEREQLLVNGKTPSLLIVEDNDELRRYLCDYFESMYTVIEAGNGKEGLEMASKVLPDIIISDVMMPEMNGLEFCKRLKTDLKTSHIPFIMLTAKAPIENQIEGIETGADDYIVKPFNLAYLQTKVKNLLLSKERLREKYKTEITLEPSIVTPVSPDEKLLQKLLQYVEDRIADSELNIEDICSEIGLSRTHLYRKVKALTGFSMAELIKELRLKRAMQLLKDHKFNVNEVAYMVGFNDADYFRKCFKTKFNMPPSEYYKSVEIREKPVYEP